MNRGSLPFDERIDTATLAEQLAGALQRSRARDVTVVENRVSFAGVARYVSSWNVLALYSGGELVINRGAGRLEYKVSFRRLILTLTAFSVLAIVGMLALGLPMGTIPGVLATIWLWLGGANVLIGRARFERFLRRTIGAALVRSDE